MTKAQDPPHGGSSVDKQLENENGGFVQTYMDERGGPTGGAPRRRDGLPPGQAPAGLRPSEREVLRLRPLVQLGRRLDVPEPPVRDGRPRGGQAREHRARRSTTCTRSFRHLDGVKGVSWATFVHDVTPILWAVDNDYPFDHLLGRARGLVRRPFPAAALRRHVHPARGGGEAAQRLLDRPQLRRPAHRADAASSRRPQTTTTRRRTSPLGQALVLKVYDALASSPQWAKTMLVITYDEHGGFFDHVAATARTRPTTTRRSSAATACGCRRSSSHRWSAGAASRMSSSTTPRSSRRSCSASRARDKTIPDMGKRVTQRAAPRRSAHGAEAAPAGDPRALPARSPRRSTPYRKDATARAAHARRQRSAPPRRRSSPTSSTTTSPSRPSSIKQLVKEEPDRLTTFVP